MCWAYAPLYLGAQQSCSERDLKIKAALCYPTRLPMPDLLIQCDPKTFFFFLKTKCIGSKISLNSDPGAGLV